MARDEAPPFARGETWANGGKIDATDLGGVNMEGREFVFEVNSEAAESGYVNTGTDPSGRPIRVKVVRNTSGAALKGGRLAHYAAEAPYEGHVDGYTFAYTDRPAGVVDEFLPAAGVPDDDLFYIVIDGPTKVTQLSASAATLVIGSALVPGTGTSATNNDAGRVDLQSQAGATTVLGGNLQHLVGYAAAASDSVEDALVAAVVHLHR